MTVGFYHRVILISTSEAHETNYNVKTKKHPKERENTKMEYYNEMKIEMMNRKMANQALTIIKDTIKNTNITEDCQGQFEEFSNSLAVKKNAVIIDDIVSVYIDSFEALIKEICTALATYFSDSHFEGFAAYLATYETKSIGFTYADKNISYTTEYMDLLDCEEE